MLLLRIYICSKAAGCEFGQELWEFWIAGRGKPFPFPGKRDVLRTVQMDIGSGAQN